MQHLYDQTYNLLYFFVQPTEKQSTGILDKISSYTRSSGDGGFSNLIIFDIPKNLHIPIFSDEEMKGNVIRSLFFEQSFDAATQSMNVANSGIYIINNGRITEREPFDRMLIETYNSKRNETCIWMSDKWGFTRKIFCAFSGDSSWHLDLYNQHIRIITPTNNNVVVEQLEWK